MAIDEIQPSEFEKILLDIIADGYDMGTISRKAVIIYNTYGTRLNSEMHDIILDLIATSEGPQFEISRDEFMQITERVRSMDSQ